MMATIGKVGAVAGPQLARRGERLIARPQATEGERTEVDLGLLIEEERDLPRDDPASAADETSKH